jgi:hypothetical protein
MKSPIALAWRPALGLVFMVMPLGDAAFAARPHLDGVWGGDRARLIATDSGANLELECADGSIQGPIQPADDGTFTAVGTFASRGPGPQRVDAPAPPVVRYAGSVTNDLLTLSVWVPGVEQPQTWRLRKGAKTKMVRCY